MVSHADFWHATLAPDQPNILMVTIGIANTFFQSEFSIHAKKFRTGQPRRNFDYSLSLADKIFVPESCQTLPSFPKNGGIGRASGRMPISYLTSVSFKEATAIVVHAFKAQIKSPPLNFVSGCDRLAQSIH